MEMYRMELCSMERNLKEPYRMVQSLKEPFQMAPYLMDSKSRVGYKHPRYHTAVSCYHQSRKLARSYWSWWTTSNLPALADRY